MGLTLAQRRTIFRSRAFWCILSLWPAVLAGVGLGLEVSHQHFVVEVYA